MYVCMCVYAFLSLITHIHIYIYIKIYTQLCLATLYIFLISALSKSS